MYLKLKSALAFFRTRLDARLMVMFIGVALLPLLVGGLMSYQRVRASLINLALSKVEQEAALTAKDLGTYLEHFSSDLLMLSSAPPVQGLLRAQDNDGLDPATGRSYEEWIDWLRQLFATTMQSKKFYQQLRYLDVNGEEIVRVDYHDGAITIVWNRVGQDSNRFLLENRVNASYFTLTQQLQPGEVAVSPLILSPEEEAENQPVPIIYFSTPIYDLADHFRGVVVSTVYATSFLNRLSVNRGQLYLTDQAGFYLAHPDPTRTFGTEREAGYNVTADFSNSYQTLLNSNNNAYTALDEQRAEVVALHKFHFDPLHPEQYWLLIRTLPQDEVLGPVKTLGALMVGVALLVTVAVALLAHRLAGNFTRPIIRLTQVAEQISQKELPQLVDSLGRVAAGEMAAQFDLSVEPVEVRSEDEIGQLETAFNKMAASLREAHPRLLKMQEQLRLQKEAAEAANQAKSTFLANMSHELRTPLNAILGYAQILRQQPLEAHVIDKLHTVQRSGEHLLTLINDILDIAKIEAGKTELFPTEIHFPSFLVGVVDIIRSRAGAKNLRFAFEAMNPLPDGIQADETRLRQVLLNLLGNAVKFTDEGQVTLRVSKLQITNGELPANEFAICYLRFEVEDTGAGIPSDQLERIFQPFEQVGEVSRRAEGTGLGLTVSRQLVRLMGGELHVESEPGQGSRFWFEVALPVMEAAVEPVHPPERAITGYTGPRRTVLVADDTPSNRAMLVDLLQPLGFKVFEAADGQQAIQLAQEIRPDLILMDRRMPVLNGFEAMRQIRQNSELTEVPIIAISASVSAEDQVQSREVGYNDFLPKPIHWPNLAALLAEYLDLEWSYSEEKAEGIQPSPFSLQPAEVPPQKDLAVLLDLARRGNMLAIREWAAHIETLGEQYVAFTRRLRELTIGFEETEILALIKQYMMEGDK